MNFDKLKEVWSNTKYKAAIKLFIYLLIIIFALFTARSTAQNSSNSNTTKKTNLTIDEVLTNFKDLSNFKATYDIDGEKYIYTYVNRELLKIGDDTYFINDGKLVYTLDESAEVPTFDYDFWYLTPKYLSSLFVIGDEDYTKSYTSGKKEIGYIVSLQDFLSTFDGANLDIDDMNLVKGKKIYISVTILNDEIIGISLDLSSFYNLINPDVNDYKVNISYE